MVEALKTTAIVLEETERKSCIHISQSNTQKFTDAVGNGEQGQSCFYGTKRSHTPLVQVQNQVLKTQTPSLEQKRFHCGTKTT